MIAGFHGLPYEPVNFASIYRKQGKRFSAFGSFLLGFLNARFLDDF